MSLESWKLPVFSSSLKPPSRRTWLILCYWICSMHYLKELLLTTFLLHNLSFPCYVFNSLHTGSSSNFSSYLFWMTSCLSSKASLSSLSRKRIWNPSQIMNNREADGLQYSIVTVHSFPDRFSPVCGLWPDRPGTGNMNRDCVYFIVRKTFTFISFWQKGYVSI